MRRQANIRSTRFKHSHPWTTGRAGSPLPVRRRRYILHPTADKGRQGSAILSRAMWLPMAAGRSAVGAIASIRRGLAIRHDRAAAHDKVRLDNAGSLGNERGRGSFAWHRRSRLSEFGGRGSVTNACHAETVSIATIPIFSGNSGLVLNAL